MRDLRLDDNFFHDLREVATACGGGLSYQQHVRVLVAEHPDRPHASAWRMDAANGTAIHTVLPSAPLRDPVTLNIPENTIESVCEQASRWTGLLFNHLLFIEERPWPCASSGRRQYATFMEPEGRISLSVVNHDVAWPSSVERFSPIERPALRHVATPPTFNAGDALRAYIFLDLKHRGDVDGIGLLSGEPEVFFAKCGNRQVALMPSGKGEEQP